MLCEEWFPNQLSPVLPEKTDASFLNSGPCHRAGGEYDTSSICVEKPIFLNSEESELSSKIQDWFCFVRLLLCQGIPKSQLNSDPRYPAVEDHQVVKENELSSHEKTTMHIAKKQKPI
jgi:hypothetical protein